MVNELVGFLSAETRIDVKSLALHHMLSMTGDHESRRLLLEHAHAMPLILHLAFNGDEQRSVNKDAFFTLINMSASELDAARLMRKVADMCRLLLDYVMCPTSRFADTACAVLSNLSRGRSNSQHILNTYFEMDNNNNNNESESEQKVDDKLQERFRFEQLLQVFCTEKFNATNRLDYLAPFICNLTQLESVQRVVLADKLIMLRLLPYTTYEASVLRRGGIVGAIKNCCFNYDEHERLLFSPDLDILSRLLLPRAGPDEFDADDMDKLPLDLQYLPADKAREADPDIRIMLIETLQMVSSSQPIVTNLFYFLLIHFVFVILLILIDKTQQQQLCARKKCRDYVKEKNAYVILRELHNWEKDERVLLVLEKLVQVLIGDEPDDESMLNLHEVAVPDELSKRFYEMDRDELVKNFEDSKKE